MSAHNTPSATPKDGQNFRLLTESNEIRGKLSAKQIDGQRIGFLKTGEDKL